MILALALAAATWTWNGPSADGRTITLDLVRAEVVIEPVVGPTRIAIEASPAPRKMPLFRNSSITTMLQPSTMAV